MPAKTAAGLLIWKQSSKGKLFALCHPGGPYYRNKEDGVWTIPKGLPEPGEELFQTALREAAEECGFTIPPGAICQALSPVKYKNGKILYAWAVEIPETFTWPFSSNTFSAEWPPRSGEMQTFPETDRMEFFTADEALTKIHPVQQPLILQVNVIESKQ